MVDRMFPAPVIIRRKRQYSGDRADDVVELLRFKERAVATVVKNDECPDQKSARQNCQRNREPPGNFQAEIHQYPKRQVWDDGVCQLPDSARDRRLLISCDNFFPGQTAEIQIIRRTLLDIIVGFYMHNVCYRLIAACSQKGESPVEDDSPHVVKNAMPCPRHY